jgi:hypothetical protein
MFTKNTVFILGAGASWHYGYPTGEELVKKIIHKVPHVIQYFSHLAKTQYRILPNVLGVEEPDSASAGEIAETSHAALEQCLALKAGLEQVNPRHRLLSRLEPDTSDNRQAPNRLGYSRMRIHPPTKRSEHQSKRVVDQFAS